MNTNPIPLVPDEPLVPLDPEVPELPELPEVPDVPDEPLIDVPLTVNDPEILTCVKLICNGLSEPSPASIVCKVLVKPVALLVIFKRP